VSVARRKLIVVAGAVGLALGLTPQATGSAGPSSAPEVEGISHGRVHPASVNSHRTPKDVDRSSRNAPRSGKHRRSRTVGHSNASSGYPTPESVGVSMATLDAIAACESGDDPTAVSADGTYGGKYQFDYGTWASVGGSGDPAAASVAEQDYRAALLYARSGTSSWPICG
jgi:hypothetical protein